MSISLPLHPSFHRHRHSLAHVRGLPALACNRLIGFVASSMVGFFLPIFLYEFFHASLSLVIAWYALELVVKFPFFVWAAKIYSHTGLLVSMIVGTLGTMLFYWAFFLLDAGSSFHPYVLMGTGIFGLAVVSAFYWSPFHIDLAQMTVQHRRGRQIAVFYAIERVLGVLAPVLAGFVIVAYGYKINFLLALIITAASIIPLFFLPHFHVTYEFGFVETFRKLFSRRFRGMALSMMAFGAENVVGLVIWPIFLFMIFKGDHFEVGAFASVIVIVGLVFELFIGRQSDRTSPKRLLRLGTGVYALGWIWKGIVQTVVGVFAASAFHSLGSIMLRTPMDTMMYAQAADSGHYIDEYTVLREIALNIGRLGMLVLVFFFTQSFSLASAFFLAALVSLGVNFLGSRRV